MLQLEVAFDGMVELDAFWSAIPPERHRAWSQRAQHVIIDGSPQVSPHPPCMTYAMLWVLMTVLEGVCRRVSLCDCVLAVGSVSNSAASQHRKGQRRRASSGTAKSSAGVHVEVAAHLFGNGLFAV